MRSDFTLNLSKKSARHSPRFCFYLIFGSVPLMVMMMMVMVCTLAVNMSRAVFLVAVLVGSLELYGGMAYAVVAELFSYFVFYKVPVFFCHHVHCGIVAVSVYASDVNMVDIHYAVNFCYVLFNFADGYAVGCLFEKKV